MFRYHNQIAAGLFVLLLAPVPSSFAQDAAEAPPVLGAPADADPLGTPPADAAATPPPAAAVAPADALSAAPPADAALQQPDAAAPADPAGGPVPNLADTLADQGALNDQGAMPAALPPGFDLPLDDTGASSVSTKSPEERQLEMRKKAFDAVVNGMFALKPDEIRKLIELRDVTRQASETPLFPTPNMESVFATVSLDPGSKPIEIKTAIGSVTTLSIVDASGQPWPIRDLSWAGNFDIQQPEAGGNMLRITPTAEFAYGNVSMRLLGLNPPIIMIFKADRQSVHVRIDVQIPELGPNGVAPLIETNAIPTTAGNSRLASVLEGIAPSTAKKLELSGVDGRTTAYNEGGRMYLRTPYTLLSPAWSSSVRSADGTNVYYLPTTPVLLMSDKGRMVRATLVSGEEQASVTGEDLTHGK